MTFDSVAAVQARIIQIEQLVAGRSTGGAGATRAASSAGAASGSATAAAAADAPEFASLLADAMASGTVASDPLSDGASTGDASLGGSPMLSQLSQLSQLAQVGTGGAVANGLTGFGSLTGVTGLGGATGLTAGALTQGAPAGSGNPLAQQFLTTALAEQGKPYVYGATANVNDPDPAAFDCSELTKWAAARNGITIPDGATAQYLYVRDHGTTMSVQQALHTPGALLFHFSHEPRNLGDIPADGHVAISLGDGVHTIEARGHAYGTNVFANAAGRDFDFAGMIPQMA